MAYEEYYGRSGITDPKVVAMLRRRKMAEDLMKTGSDTSPAATPLVGLSRVLQGLVGGYTAGMADKDASDASAASDAERQAAMAQAQALIDGAGGGGTMPAMVEPTAQPAQQPTAGTNAPPPEWMPYYEEASKETGIPVETLIAKSAVESNFRPDAVSPTGATGVTQTLASTARDPGYGVAPVDPATLKNPRDSIMFGARYLAGRAKALGVTDWNNPTQRRVAFNAYSGADTPQGDKGYADKIEARLAGGAPSAAPQAGAPPQQSGIAYAQRLLGQANKFLMSPDPVIRRQAEPLKLAAEFAMKQAEQEQRRAADVPPTIQMQDPDGKGIGIYERTPNGVGRRIGAAPRQPGESGGPFAGTGMDQQAANILLQVGPAIANGTATPEQQNQYALAYQHVEQGKVSMIPDPTDPSGQRQVMARIPGAVPPQFPRPGGGQPAPAPDQAGGQPQAAPGAPVPIPGTTKPGPPLTEAQGRIATFADRIAATLPIIEANQSAGLSYPQNALRNIPVVGNALISNEMQQLDQAQRNFINAVLRRESGAVISPEEFDNAKKQYFPVPGDKPDVLEQKKKNRQDVLEGFAREGGPTYKIPEQKKEAPALPPQAAANLKEGQQTTFGNGQVWTLQGGNPVRVK